MKYVDPDGRIVVATVAAIGLWACNAALASFGIYKAFHKSPANSETQNPSDVANNTNLANPNVLNGSADQLASNMEALVGTNYVWGGNSPADGGMDCSGSLIYGINQMGNNLPDQTANDLYGLTVPVTGEPQRGDLRFLSNSNGVQVHVQTITNSNGTRVNATGGPENTITNPGVIEQLTTELPSTGEIRRLQFNE